MSDIGPSKLVKSLTPDNLGNQSPESDTIDFFDVDNETYPRTYNFLKSQYDVLVGLDAAIKADKEISPAKDIKHYDFLAFLIDSVLMSDFSTVFLQATNEIPAIQNIINTDNVSQNVLSIATSLLSVVINLSRVFSYVSCTLPTSVQQPSAQDERRPSNPNEEKKAKNPSNVQPDPNQNHDQMLVLCRICEEYVPIDMIEEHSKNCVIAYESEFTMITTDEKIKKLQKAIRNSVLNEKWPGPPNTTISTILPLLHVTMLLDFALQEKCNDINNIYEALKKIEIHAENPNAQSFLAKAQELMAEKVKASDTFNEASEVLKATRVSGQQYGAHSLQTTIADFTFLKRISSGAFAKVFLAVKIKTGDIYAIKVTPKSSLKQKNTLRRTLIEKDILLQNSNPFIVDFYYSIIGEHNLYLVMEYLPGGDLYSLLQNMGSLDEESARTYTAQIVKALEYLHSHGIIHRDLKPDNVLIDVNGKLKLTDFGLSLYGTYDRNIQDDNKSIVGTPDYLAPEIILSHPHSYTADYWSLGAVIYEFLVGEPPFHRETESKTFAQILSGHFNVDYLEGMSPEVIDLIKKLLTLDPEKRLGAHGIKEIMDHPWFKDIDWDNIDSLEPPFVPDQKDKYSVSYFTERYTFQKNDDIEKDVLEDIEIAKTATPQSVSMTDLSSRNSFASKHSEEDTTDSQDDMAMFPAIALKNLSKRASIGAGYHKRSNSVEKAFDIGSEPKYYDLTSSKSFAFQTKSPLEKRRGSMPPLNENMP